MRGDKYGMTPTDKKIIVPDLPSFTDRMYWLFKQDKNIKFVVLNNIPLKFKEKEPSVVNNIPLKFKEKEPSVVRGLVHFSEVQGDDGGIHPISIPCDSVEELLMFLKTENKDFKLKPVKEVHSSEKQEVSVSARVQLKLSNAHYQVLYTIDEAREEEHREMLRTFKR
jgi:LEA14-like dessication related protein